MSLLICHILQRNEGFQSQAAGFTLPARAGRTLTGEKRGLGEREYGERYKERSREEYVGQLQNEKKKI